MPTTRLVARLKATAGVTAIVGTKIYPMLAPQSATIPYIVYEKTLDSPVNDANGTGSTSQKRYTVACFAATYDGAQTLGAAVQAALSGWKDSSNCIWHLDTSSDEVGEVMSGRDVPEYYASIQEYNVWC
jgi:hypothetical protein